MILLLAKFLNCGEKTDRNGKIIGNYGIAQDNTHRPHELVPVFYFRFRWVQKVMFKLLTKVIQFFLQLLLVITTEYGIGGEDTITSNTSFIISMTDLMEWAYTQRFHIGGLIKISSQIK